MAIGGYFGVFSSMDVPFFSIAFPYWFGRTLDDDGKGGSEENGGEIQIRGWADMKTNIELTGKQESGYDLDNKEVQHRAERIWKAVSRYVSNHVSIDKDGIFKDPDWPHLWNHKR